jgi:hypothetical protein
MKVTTMSNQSQPFKEKPYTSHIDLSDLDVEHNSDEMLEWELALGEREQKAKQKSESKFKR